MKFGPVPVRDAQGAVLAHALKLPDGRKFAKGQHIDARLAAELAASGIETVIVARLAPDDVGEDEAAQAIANALVAPGLRLAAAATGRVNVFATVAGLFVAAKDRVDAVNAADPGITLACLPQLSPVEPGRMVATVKIIPYGIARQAAERAAAIATGAIGIEPFRAMKVGVVSTRLPSLKDSAMDKTMRVLAERLRPSGSRIVREIRTAHESEAIGVAIKSVAGESDVIVVFGASAICDIEDVIPSGLRAAGGTVVHFGMPVDPGNLLLLGSLSGKPAIGAPGCARSPAENGFDWVLNRILAGREVSSGEITAMGVGGLLMEIGARPQPRNANAVSPGPLAALVLAAGRSTRMGAVNKLAAEIGGMPMLRHALMAATGSSSAQTIVVTGHERERVEALLAGLAVRPVHNPDYANGLATSLAAGIAAVPQVCGGVIVLLGDMPRITAEMIDRMADAFAATGGEAIIVATHGGERGNPVIWPRRHFAALTALTGDKGARDLIASHAGEVVTVELGPAAGFDVDTPVALVGAANG
jgi:molybdenum cofactor cytidylyltransferase